MFSMKIDYDMNDVTVPRRILRKLNLIPDSIWDMPKKTVLESFRSKAKRIRRFNVKPSTVKWRKSKAERGRTVPTYVGAEAPVLAGSRVGKRTHTFLKDFETASPPTVTMEVRNGPYKVMNGTFYCEVHPEAFDREYPIFFEDYLKERGIIPEDGLVALEDIEINEIFDYLEDAVASIAEKALLS